MAPLRPILSDLVRETGLSSATVDRVINNRQGVHPRTRDLVLTTAKRLGYLSEVDAPTVADSQLGRLRFRFLLPAGTNAFIAALRRQIEAQAAARPELDVRIETIEGFNPNSLARHLDQVPAGLDGLGLVALDHPLVREGLRRLAQRGVKVVTLVSDVLTVPRVAYIGVDNRQAGRLAGFILGRFLVGRDAPKVAFFAGSRFYRGHEEREMGFRSVLAEDFPAIQVVAQCESMDDPDRAHAETQTLLNVHPDLAAVYNAGAGNPGIARALGERDLSRRVVLVGHEATEGNKRLLLEGVLDAVIDQNPRVEAREALNALTMAARQESYAVVAPRLQVVFRENLPED